MSVSPTLAELNRAETRNTLADLHRAIDEFLTRGPGSVADWVPGEEVDDDDLASAVILAAIDHIEQLDRTRTQPRDINPVLVLWSEFARRGRHYADRIANGVSFLVIKDSRPFALVTPVDPETITITVSIGENPE